MMRSALACMRLIGVVVAVVAILLTIVIVHNGWHYGVVYYRYGCFYLATFILFVMTIADWVCISKCDVCSVTWLDILLTVYLVWILLNYYLSSSIAESYLYFAILLYISYLCLRYWFHVFPILRVWILYGILLIGFIEIVWGILQLYKLLPSYHVEYLITGSFLNPGPYGGFLAICIPLAVSCFLRVRNKGAKLVTLFFLLSVITMLPASMSRSSWMASILGVGCVLFFHYQLKNKWENMTCVKKTVVSFTGGALFLVGVYLLYMIKEVSVWGRLQVWMLSIQIWMKHLLLGVGLGNFSAAFGYEQIEGFKTGNSIFPLDENLSDCPEYAFNEFIHAGVELGSIVFLLLSLIFILSLRENLKNGNWAVAGSLVALGVFSCFSYPLRLLPFLIVWICLLAESSQMCCLNFPIRRFHKLFIGGIACMLCLLFYDRLQHFKALEQWNKACYSNEFKKSYKYLRDQHLYLINYADALIIEKKYFEANCVIHQLQTYYCDLRPLILEGLNWQASGDMERAEQNFIDAHYLVPNRFLPCLFLVRHYLKNREYQKAVIWAEYTLEKPVVFAAEIVEDIRKEMKQVVKKYKNEEE